MISKKVIYTCITGQYDEIVTHDFVHPDYDYVCFTDSQFDKQKNPCWTIRPLKFDKLDNVRNARWHKMHPHLLFPEYEESLYLDGNIQIKNKSFFQQIEKFKNSQEYIKIGKHFSRTNLFNEFNQCLQVPKDNPQLIKLQLDKIKKSDFNGIYLNKQFFETNCILRKHHHPDCIKIMENWWWWIENYSYRDQLSLTYVLWKNKIEVNYLFGEKNIRSLKSVAINNSLNHEKNEILKLKNQIATLKEELKEINDSKIFKVYNLYQQYKEKLLKK